MPLGQESLEIPKPQHLVDRDARLNLIREGERLQSLTKNELRKLKK